MYLCVLCGSQNKQPLFPYTTLTVYSLAHFIFSSRPTVTPSGFVFVKFHFEPFHQTISPNHFAKPLHQTVSPNHFTKPFHQTVSPNRFTKPFHQTISPNRFTKPFHQTISPNHFTKPFHQTSSSNRFTKPFHQTISPNHFTKPFHQTVSPNHFTKPFHQTQLTLITAAPVTALPAVSRYRSVGHQSAIHSINCLYFSMQFPRYLIKCNMTVRSEWLFIVS